jgi:hypothetical protein
VSLLPSSAVSQTNFLEKSMPRINAFFKEQSTQRISYLLLGSSLWKKPQNGQEKRHVPNLSQGFVLWAASTRA